LTSQDGQARVERHVAAFNAAVRSGDWRSFADRFAPDATMRFTGVPAGPFRGRAAIAMAYAQQPPADTLTARRVDSADTADTADFEWSSGGTGVMRLSWQDDLVDELDVIFDAAGPADDAGNAEPKHSRVRGMAEARRRERQSTAEAAATVRPGGSPMG
jgi:steroid Delta-isomerase